jgi:hypothetical protein
MEGSNSRWWETYLVRYITGSVVGAVIVYILLRKLRIYWFPSLKDIQNTHLVILGSLGFAYCYIASAPITLLHAVRSILVQGAFPTKFDWSFFAILCALTLLGGLLGWASNPILWGLSAASMTILTYVYVISIKRYKNLRGNKEWERWYFKLATKRAETTKDQSEFVESYRHLREHGNAFFIVVLEICLGVILYQIATLLNRSTPENKAAWSALLLVAILYWIAAGAVCWFLGNKLEKHLIER